MVWGGWVDGIDAKDHRVTKLEEGTMKFKLTIREGCYNRKK